MGGVSSKRTYVPSRHLLALIQMPLYGQSPSSGPGHSQAPRIDSKEGMVEKKGKEKENAHLDPYLIPAHNLP